MKKSKEAADFRAVDEVVTIAGEALRDDPRDSLLWRCVYVLAVALWHLLEREAKRK